MYGRGEQGLSIQESKYGEGKELIRVVQAELYDEAIQLIKDGVYLHTHDSFGQTALDLALIKARENDFMALLLVSSLQTAGAKRSICAAAREGDLDTVLFLLDEERSGKIPNEVLNKNNDGQTPFMLAVRNGHVAIARLLAHGANSMACYDSSLYEAVKYKYHSAQSDLDRKRYKATMELLKECERQALVNIHSFFSGAKEISNLSIMFENTMTTLMSTITRIYMGISYTPSRESSILQFLPKDLVNIINGYVETPHDESPTKNKKVK